MKKKVLAAVLCASMVMTALAGCGKSESGEGKEKSEFSGETLEYSDIRQAGWTIDMMTQLSDLRKNMMLQ